MSEAQRFAKRVRFYLYSPMALCQSCRSAGYGWEMGPPYTGPGNGDYPPIGLCPDCLGTGIDIMPWTELFKEGWRIGKPERTE